MGPELTRVVVDGVGPTPPGHRSSAAVGSVSVATGLNRRAWAFGGRAAANIVWQGYPFDAAGTYSANTAHNHWLGIGRCRRYGRCAELVHEVSGHGAQANVGFLGVFAQEIKSLVGVDAVDGH